MRNMSFKVGEAIVESGQKLRGSIRVTQASTHQVTIPYIIISGSEKGPTLTVLSGVHAVECAPVEAMFRLSDIVSPQELKGTLVIIPVVNTEGFHTRKPYHNQLDHLNQNQVFPGDPEGSITKRVAHTIFETFVSKSDYLVDCHSADIGEDATHGMFIYETEDEELHEKMVQMASCFECYFIETTKISGNTGVAIKEYQIPCIMTESGAPFPIREDDVQYHVDGVLNLMKHLGMMKGEASVTTPPIDPLTKRLWAQTGGAWRRQVEAGKRVKEDQLLGAVSSLNGETLQKVYAPFSGVVSFLRTHYSVNEGDTLLWIAQV